MSSENACLILEVGSWSRWCAAFVSFCLSRSVEVRRTSFYLWTIKARNEETQSTLTYNKLFSYVMIGTTAVSYTLFKKGHFFG